MATARITCPDCKSVLRPAKPVPDGKKVKCPKCGNVFTTPGLTEEVFDVQAVEEPPKKASAKKAPEKKKQAAVKKAGSVKPPGNVQSPPKKKTAYEEEEEQSGGIYAFFGAKKEGEEEERPDINYAPDMSIKDLRGPAQEMVVKPSNLMMLLLGLSALSNLFLVCWSFWPMVFSESVVDWDKTLRKYYLGKDNKEAIQRIDGYKEFKDIKDEDMKIIEQADERAVYDFWVGGFPPMGRVWMIGQFVLLLLYDGVAMIGAVKMQNLESRRWSIASSIMMLLPAGTGGLSALFTLGLFFVEQITGVLGDEMAATYGIGISTVPYLASIAVAIMALRVLFNQKVIDGFEYVAD